MKRELREQLTQGVGTEEYSLAGAENTGQCDQRESAGNMSHQGQSETFGQLMLLRLRRNEWAVRHPVPDLGNGSVDARNGLFCVRSGVGGRGYLGRCDSALNISSVTHFLFAL